MLLYLSPILAVIVYLAAVHPFRIKLWWKLLIFAVLVCASLKYFILHLFGGPVFFAPDLPRGVMIFSAWVYAVFLSWAAFVSGGAILRGISRVIFLIRKKELPQQWNKIVNYGNLILLAIALITSTLGIYWGTCLPPVRERTIYLKDLPPNAEGMRIAMLADLHIDYIMEPEFLREIVRRTNAAKPHMIVIVGDIVDGTIERLGDRVMILKELQSPFGTWGVPGNHEYYSGFHDWNRFFREKAGIRMLLNESVRLTNDVFLAGTTDQAAKRFREDMPDSVKAAGKRITPASCAILLAHNPKVAHMAKEKDLYDLQLSGHTHGGMIYGLDLLVRQMNGGFVSGLYQVKNMQLYLTNGTAIWSGFPVRFGRPSEIALITLRKQKSAQKK